MKALSLGRPHPVHLAPAGDYVVTVMFAALACNTGCG